MNDEFGLKPEIIRKIQTKLSNYPEIEEAILYGSRAMGNYKNGSDIDLTLKTSEHNMTLSIIEIGVALDELNLPYTFDLSFYKNLNNPDLIDHINRVGISFYKK